MHGLCVRQARFVVVSVLLLSTVTTTATAQKAKSVPAVNLQGQFIVLKGNDTVAVENFIRDQGVLTGQIVQTAGPRNEYTMILQPNAQIEHVDITRKFKAGGQMSITLDLSDKSVNVNIGSANESEKMTIPTTIRPIPFFVFSFALAEQIVRAAALPVGQSTKMLAVRLGSGDTATVNISRFHADSASLVMSDVGIKVALASDGRVIGGTHMSQGWTVRRIR